MYQNALCSVCFAMIAFLMTGCRPLTPASRIDVQFDNSVQGLQKGDKVYLLGVSVGEIDNPSIVNGRPSVPVTFRDDGVFGQDGQVLFYIASDPASPGHRSLVAVIHSVPIAANEPRFRGFGSKTKLMLLMGAEKAEAWWNSLGLSK